MKDKKGFIQNWGLFFILAVVGIIMGLIMLKIWGSMDYNPGVVTKVLMFTLVPIVGATFFTWYLENN